jgi:translation initiation factor 3 subunit E
MADYDLSKTIIPYLDRHLTLALLDYLAETSLFLVEEVQAVQYEVAKETNMVDYVVGLFEKLHPGEEVPAGTFVMLPTSQLNR